MILILLKGVGFSLINAIVISSQGKCNVFLRISRNNSILNKVKNEYENKKVGN